MTIFVGNLPYKATEQDIEKLFQHKASARIVYDRDTKQSKGFGFVDLDTAETAKSELARLQSSTVTLMGRQVRFGEAETKPERGNHKTRDDGRGNQDIGNGGRKHKAWEREARNKGYTTY